MKYDLFVFAGQSNTMGACVLPPEHKLQINSCMEYKYKPVYLGGKTGEFVTVGYNSGEFLYKDIETAYQNTDENGRSRLDNYGENTHFVSAMSNLKSRSEKTVNPFSIYSESERNMACSIIPYFCEEWEKLECSALTAHIAKGGVNIVHFFSEDMIAEYNRFAADNGFNRIDGDGKAEQVYCEKCRSFFNDAAKKYGNACLGEKILVWHQGESDSGDSCAEYKQKLHILWKKAKKIGFEKLFIIRVGYWFTHDTCHIMQAQEEFCTENKDAFIISRDISYMPDLKFMENPGDYYCEKPEDKYFFCRDSFYGYDNSHINEKGFEIAAKTCAKNAYRILKEGVEPINKKDIVKY